jgi:sulfur-oxidizing protein SoxY
VRTEGDARRSGSPVLIVAAAAGGLGLARGCLHHGAAPAAGSEGGARPGPAREGVPPEIRLPMLTENGAKVPIVVEVDHPMADEHHVTSIAVVNERDPLPTKGEFMFTAANGQAYVAFQVRLDDGRSTVRADVECSRGTRWTGVGATRVADGTGGCAGAAPRPERVSAEIRPPVIRLPRAVRGERIDAGQVIDVQVVIQHPVRTGLERRGDAWTQASEPFYVTEMAVFLGADRVSYFRLTPAVSDNSLITFRLRPRVESVLRVVLRNNRGARFEAEHPIRFG